MDAYITKALELIEDATNGLTEQELTARQGDQWSPAQVLEHLAKAFGGSAKAFELQLAAGEIQPLRALTIKDRIGIFIICDVGYFPSGRNAPEKTIPSESPSGFATVARIKENLVRVDKALDETEKKWGSHVKVYNHLVLGPLTVPQWRKFHFVHTRHHIRQVVSRAAANRNRALAKSA